MRNLLLIIIVVLSCFFVPLGVAYVLPVAKPAQVSVSRNLTPTSVEQALKTAELLDEDGDGRGSCWPVAVQNGCVAFVSCAHVLEDGPRNVRLLNGDVMPVVFSIYNDALDVGITWARGNPHAPIVPLPLADANAPIGTDVLLAGYPLECGLWMSRGIVGSPNTQHGGTWTSAAIYYGCSGGPVFADGKVVGVAKGVLTDSWRKQVVSPISFMVPVDSFRVWLQEVLSHGPNVK